jgi:hypothetical protein
MQRVTLKGINPNPNPDPPYKNPFKNGRVPSWLQPLRAIIGGTIGGMALLAGVVVAALLLRRKRQLKPSECWQWRGWQRCCCARRGS